MPPSDDLPPLPALPALTVATRTGPDPYALPFRSSELSGHELERLVADGLLEHVLPGVVAATGRPDSPARRSAAVACSLPPGPRSGTAVAVDATAAWVWVGGPAPPVVAVALPPGRRLGHRPWVVVHERRLVPEDVETPGDVAVTTPARTVADLLRGLPEPISVPLATPVVLGYGVTAQAVEACLARLGRARGVVRARRVTAAWPFRQSRRLPVMR